MNGSRGYHLQKYLRGSLMMTPMLESLIQEQPRVVYVEDEKSTTQLLATEEGRRLEYEARPSDDAGQRQ